jgi:hypothetical protein
MAVATVSYDVGVLEKTGIATPPMIYVAGVLCKTGVRTP